MYLNKLYKITAVLLIALSACLYSQVNTANLQQQAYKIPFSSSDNIIDLAIVNTSNLAIKNVKVSSVDLPDWIKMNIKEAIIPELKQNEENEVEFSFNVDKAAPVGKETSLKFLITGSTGEVWNKQIKVSVSAPDNYELFQNYPNPFNPSTTISYQLPAQSKVSLKIYNMLGEEVVTIMDNLQEAGYYTMKWNASLCSSGMYIYQLIAKRIDGHEYIQRKKMSLIK